MLGFIIYLGYAQGKEEVVPAQRNTSIAYDFFLIKKLKNVTHG